MSAHGDRLHWANAALVLACAALARWRPVELLVLSYALAGPAHYLTQLSWLEQRRFYSTARYDAGLLAAAAAALLWAGQRPDSPWWGAALGLAAGAAFLRILPAKLAAGVLGAAAAWWLVGRGWTLWALLLPSVVHVFAFTALFLWRGAARDRTPAAWSCAAVHLGCGAALLLAPHGGASLPGSLKKGLDAFLPVGGTLAWGLGRDGWPGMSGALSFLAFAYAYHYANWFSKAGFLGWHRMGGGRAAALTAAYAALLGAYAWSFEAGFALSAGLGLVHVVAELPLDAVAAAGLVRVGAASRAARRPS